MNPAKAEPLQPLTPADFGPPIVVPLNIIQRIQAAQRDIAKAKFEKTHKVTMGAGGGYKIIPIADILQIVRKVQAEHGITLLLGKVQYDEADHEGVEGGHAVGHIDYKLVGSSMDDCIEGTVTVEARDPSDKLNNKLVTNAMRTIYRTIYSIDAGEDPEMENAPITRTAAPKATETTSDREPEIMAQTILKARADGICKITIEEMVKAYGEDPIKWPSTTIKQVYRAVVNKRRMAEAEGAVA